MKVTQFSRMVDVSVATARRWVKVYDEFLTPSANPPKGETRTLTHHDQQVLYYAAQLRDAGLSQDAVVERLRALQDNDWIGLTELPSEWRNGADTVTVSVAASRASELAQVAVLQAELQHIRRELEQAQNRVGELEAQLNTTGDQLSTSENEKNELRLELERARGEVEKFRAQLASYSFGREAPVNVGFILLSALLIGALLVAVAFVLARLLM